MFPMLAASLVLTTSPDVPPASGHLPVVPLASSSAETSHDAHNAKQLGAGPSKPGVSAAKGTTRGRALPVGALKAFEGSDDDEEDPVRSPSSIRASGYVC